MLRVTKVALRARAMPAIKLSSEPIGRPRLSSSACTVAAARAAGRSNGRTDTTARNASNCLRRFVGCVDLAMPTSISYSVLTRLRCRLAMWQRGAPQPSTVP